jgi:hypothetical protein
MENEDQRVVTAETVMRQVEELLLRKAGKTPPYCESGS